MPRATADGDIFAALASPARRELLNLLITGPRTAGDLASHFDMARPSVSEHLRVLRTAGLVSEQKSGRERYYQLDPEPLTQVRDWLSPYEQFWRERLRGLREVLDDDNPTDDGPRP